MANEYGTTKGTESLDVFQQGEIVIYCLAEPYARIDDDRIGDALLSQPSNAVLQKREGLRYNIGVTGRDLHGFGISLHMHDYQGTGGLAGDRDHVRVAGKGADVVDDIGTCSDSLFCDRRLGSVNGNRYGDFFTDGGNGWL